MLCNRATRLLGIALAFGVPMASIQALNDLPDPDMIRAGQKLRIPTEPLPAGEGARSTLYIVRPGDTHSAPLPRAFSFGVSDLTRANQIAEDAIIRVGQKLVIPVQGVRFKRRAPPAPGVELIPLVPVTAPAPASGATQAPPASPRIGRRADGISRRSSRGGSSRGD
ncbi:MAG: hypothetical protein KatS3mg052_0628 [Candidatus Roseilinea sp.]|nr:MAG: hypothetical protein KatS3mg052_0628 [Candidatus Roseilinea sp.]